MPPDAAYYDDVNGSPPQYGGYDESGYGSPVSSRTSSAQYSNHAIPYSKSHAGQLNGNYNAFDFRQSYEEPHQQAPVSQPVGNGGQFQDFQFHPDEEQVTSHHISLNTKLHEPNHDVVGQHLLYETALFDSQAYAILDIDQVDALKKEHARLEQRLEAATRKLMLESKVKDAAQNLQRLYSTSKKNDRPDTPQNPDSPRKGRNSLLSDRGRAGSLAGGQTLHQAEQELAQSVKKVEDLQDQVKSMLERRQVVERRLLQHTAAVLAEQASKTPEQRTDALTNKTRAFDHDELHLPGPDEFDGIRDILRGLPAPPSKSDVQRIQEDHTQQLSGVQERLEQLNVQLRLIITEASRTRGEDPTPEPVIKRSPDPKDRLEGAFELLESNVRALQQSYHAQDTAPVNAVEEQLGMLNIQMHKTLQISSEFDAVKNISPPPEITGHGYQHQLQYMGDAVLSMEDLLRQHHEQYDAAESTSRSAAKQIEDAQSKASRAGEYETVLAGLWHILSADGPGALNRDGGLNANNNGDQSPLTPLKEDFSIQAFSSHVQHLHDVANGAKEQQDILRRQIQQQRDLNGKSDMEKSIQLDELSGRYDEVAASHGAVQEELAMYMANHQQAEREANESRGELVKVMDELEQLRRTVDDTQARQKEVDQRSIQVTAERNDALQRHSELQQEMENLESEVVRLTTELTIAKADLEGAYGSRKERQKEAGMVAGEMEALEKLRDQEIADLKNSQEQHIETLRREFADRSRLLETELQDMTNEFQEMTRESLELEKERSQLEGLIDGLRERCDGLEAQLNDEKVRWMGIKSPGGLQDPNSGPRETTSVTVLRQEFKKMMRENRADGMRLIRAEQEERRKLESELRRLRQSAGPLGRVAATNGIASTQNRLGSSQANGLPPSAPALSPASALPHTLQTAPAGG